MGYFLLTRTEFVSYLKQINILNFFSFNSITNYFILMYWVSCYFKQKINILNILQYYF